jgi:hypothetical protein
MRTVSKILAGVVFFVLGALAISPLGSGLGEVGVFVVVGGATMITLICVMAPTGRRAWGRGLLLNGSLLIAMPLLIIPLLGQTFFDTTSEVTLSSASNLEVAATSVGAGLGAAVVFGAATFLGTLSGLIFLLFGLVLVLGGRREVIVVSEASPVHSR